jgi:hypothetical protein
MKVALASQYRMWMYVLAPTTLGVGTAALWLRSLNWPLRVDATGVTLRHHYRVSWQAITKIGVSRSYLDGHVSQMRIHHDGGVCKIPVHDLQDGERVARTILTMFEQAHRPPRALERLAEVESIATRRRSDQHPSSISDRPLPPTAMQPRQRDVGEPMQGVEGIDRWRRLRALAEIKEAWK